MRKNTTYNQKYWDFSQICLQCSVLTLTAATRQLDVFVLAPMTDVIHVLLLRPTLASTKSDTFTSGSLV